MTQVKEGLETMLCTDTAPKQSSSLSDRIKRIKRATDLTASETLVIRVLLDFIGNNATGWPSHRRLAAETRLSISTVKRSLASLQAKRWIAIESRSRSDGSKTSNNYRWIEGFEKLTGEQNAKIGHSEPAPGHSELSHKNHGKTKTTKKHVSECVLEVKRRPQAAAPPKPARATERPPTPSKRFVKFESDPKAFRSYEACEQACEAAIKAGFFKNCESDRMIFFTVYAAVCRKLKAKKVSQPARLLRFLIESKKLCIEYSSNADEDAARKAMRELRRADCDHEDMPL